MYVVIAFAFTLAAISTEANVWRASVWRRAQRAWKHAGLEPIGLHEMCLGISYF